MSDKPTRALIVGITGQDGSYLAELLLSKGYEVWGTKRRSSCYNTGRIDHIYDQLHIEFADLTDPGSLARAVRLARPEEIYNLGAQSHVSVSFEQPAYTTETISLGTLHLLEAFRAHAPKARFYQASSSEMFGNSPPPQNESTPFDPLSPYACAKVHAHLLAQHYREAYGLWIACGILFNHESERRGETFVTRKITIGLARIKLGLQSMLVLGNIDEQRDWGHAEDYVRAMWLMLQREQPDDFVIGSGRGRKVWDFCLEVGLRLGGSPWLYDHIRTGHSQYLRPSSPSELRADAKKARLLLGWKPTITFDQLVARMTDHDLALARKEAGQ
jgi:GDPmannose 4,6-dehydratase